MFATEEETKEQLIALKDRVFAEQNPLVSDRIIKNDKNIKEYVSKKRNKEGRYVYLRAEAFKFGQQDGWMKLGSNEVPYIIAEVNGKKEKVHVAENRMILYYHGFRFVMKKEIFKRTY